jgi:predicted nucleic acid-binding protein
VTLADTNVLLDLVTDDPVWAEVLPDFFIGAHAAVIECPLLTRDAGRYRRYFPTVVLITPE